MKNIILISAKQGGGKTTLADSVAKFISEQGKPYLAMRTRFAAPLYEMQEAIRDVANKYKIPFDKKEGRLLQLLGTDWARTVKGQNVWSDALKNKIEAEQNLSEFNRNNFVYIIDDCRFRNEFHAFPNALTIRLECEEAIRKIRCDSWREDTTHPSEIDLDDYLNSFDLVIDTGVRTKQDTFTIAMAKILDFLSEENRR